MGPDLYALRCHCHFFMVGLQIMHDLGLERQKETCPVCMSSREHLNKHTHTHTTTHKRARTHTHTLLEFCCSFCLLSTTLAEREHLH